MVSADAQLSALIDEAEQALEKCTAAQQRLYDHLRQAESDPDPSPDADTDTDMDTDSDTDTEAEKFACDVDGCDYETESEHGLSIHKGRTHKDDADDADEDEDEEDDVQKEAKAAEDVEAEEDVDDAQEELDADDVDFQTFECDRCDYTSKSEKGVAIHAGQVHDDQTNELSEDIDEELGLVEGDGADDEPEEDPSFHECDACGKSFSSESSLESHRTQFHADDDTESDRTHDEDLLVEDLEDTSDLRHRSMRQQVRQADPDVGAEELAEKIGATVDVVDELQEEVDRIDAEARSASEPAAPRTDGGAAAVGQAQQPTFWDWSADPGPAERRCQGCGNHVQDDYVRVMAPEREASARVCPHCEELIRERDGTVREARSTRGNR